MRIAVLDDYQDVALRYANWGQIDADKQRFYHIADRDQLVAAIADFDIVVAMRERTAFDAALFAKLPKLKLLVTTGMRNAAIDLDAATAHGVTVCGTDGVASATAELTWGLIIGFSRFIPQEFANFRASGNWQFTVGFDLHGKTLRLLGLGRLGAQVARVGLAFGMRVIAWSQNLTRERCAEVGVQLAPSLDDLLRAEGFLSIHLQLSERTRGLIGAREFSVMNPATILINTSRGPIVDEAALIAALRGRKILGAALDVYDQEPLPADHPLRKLDNVLTTPHLGYVTQDTYKVFYAGAVEDILAWRAGKPVRVLNPK
jgi:phosphoglycerate dehydrogenase-like enzyme